MATTETAARPAEEVGTDTTNRSWKRGLIAGATAVALALGAITYANSGEETTHADLPTVDSQMMSRDEIVSDWVNRGLVPSKALDPALSSREDVVRDMVNRGLVPNQALDPASISREDILRDLVNRGLIPRQSLGE